MEHKLSFIIDAENRSKAAIDQVKGQLDTVQGKIGKMKPAFQKMALVGTAAFAAIGAGIYKSIQAYQAEERANQRLTHLLKQTSKATDAQVESLKKQASALQAVGVVGDETIKFGQSQLATFALTADAIEVLTPSMLDLVVANKGVNATQEDMITMGNLVGKVMTGQVGALSRYGVTLTEVQKEQLKSGNEMERASILAEVLQGNFGGLNESMRKTSEGGVAALKNSFGDLMEIIGKQFVPILASIVTKVAPVIERISKWIEANPELARNIIIASLAIAGLVAVVGMLGLVLPSIIAGFTLLLSPVALVIAIIAALIVVGYLLYKNWDIIKGNLAMIWETIEITFRTKITTIQNFILLWVSKIRSTFHSVGAFFRSFWEGVKTIWGNAIGWLMRKIQPFLNAYEKVRSGVTWVGEKVGGAASSAVGTILGTRQMGGYIPETGAYLLHKGETVIPSDKGAGNVFNFNFAGAFIGNREQFTKEIIDAIDRESQLKQLGGI